MNRNRNRPLSAFIWDLDGTLIDSYASIVSSLEDMARENRIQDSGEEILRAVKQGTVSGYLRGLAERSGLDYGALYRRYRELTHERLDQITLIPGAADTLAKLRAAGAEHFLYTHRGKSTETLLDRLELKPFFSEIVTFENGFQPKPSGEGVAYLAGKYGLDPETTAYVGDRTLDVLCAKDAGVKAVLYLPEDSCVIPTGQEDLVIGRLEELTKERTAAG